MKIHAEHSFCAQIKFPFLNWDLILNAQQFQISVVWRAEECGWRSKMLKCHVFYFSAQFSTEMPLTIVPWMPFAVPVDTFKWRVDCAWVNSLIPALMRVVAVCGGSQRARRCSSCLRWWRTIISSSDDKMDWWDWISSTQLFFPHPLNIIRLK